MKRALCIGISNFENPYTSPLTGCANDAKLLAALLKRHYGFQAADVRLLTNESATRSAIVAGLQWLVAEVSQGDVLVLSLATHGTRAIDPTRATGPNGEVGGNERIFLTYDCSPSNYLLRDEVAALLDRVPLNANCYCLIDTCDIGPFYYATRTDAVEDGSLEARSEQGVVCQHAFDTNRTTEGTRGEPINRIEIAACADHEQSHEVPTNGSFHGLFTFSVYQVLEGHSWYMTVGALYAAVRNTVSMNAHRMSARQSPQLRGDPRLIDREIFS